MTTVAEMRAQIPNRAAEHGEFRAHLIADPKAAISGRSRSHHTGRLRRGGARGQRHHRSPGAAAFAGTDRGRAGDGRRREPPVWSPIERSRINSLGFSNVNSYRVTFQTFCQISNIETANVTSASVGE